MTVSPRVRAPSNLIVIAVGAAVAATCAAQCLAQDAPTRTEITLLHADALDLAIRFGAEPPKPPSPEAQAALARTQRGLQERIIRRLQERRQRPFDQPTPFGSPDRRPEPRLVAHASQAPLDATYRGELAALLPEGLDGPPAALASRNSLIVRGEAHAIDEFREVVKMLDVPAKTVRIRADAVDAPIRIEQAAGVDFAVMAGQADASLLGSAPADASLLLRWAAGDFSALIGALRRETRAASQIATSITTLSSHPAVLTAGEVVPFFNPIIGYDAFGQRTVDYEVLSLFVGVELWVLPRVNGDDTVTMRLRPTLVDETGIVGGPMGTSAPVTRRTLAETIVRVPDGQSVCIAGLPRAQDSVNRTFGLAGTSRTLARSSLAVFVTPKIVRQTRDR